MLDLVSTEPNLTPSLSQRQTALDLSVVVPVLNEALNLAILVDRLETKLAHLNWEVIFVDDSSTDGSREELVRLSRSNPKVRFITRVGRSGLSSAAIEGLLSASATYLAVMDGDLQHDEGLLPSMVDTLRYENKDIVVGSRFAEQSSVGDFPGWRLAVSNMGNRVAHWVIKSKMTDPLSGFFMIRRDAFEARAHDLSGTGFKILVDILTAGAKQTPLRVAELPFKFGERLHGTSKLSSGVAFEFASMIIEKRFGFQIPLRFISFATVGGLGVALHLALLGLFFSMIGFSFIIAQAAATLITMIVNFTLNNVVTYHDKRLKGAGFLVGLGKFFLICSLGALANVQLADYLFQMQTPWIIAGTAGVVVAAVWNFVMSNTFAWSNKKQSILKTHASPI